MRRAWHSFTMLPPKRLSWSVRIRPDFIGAAGGGGGGGGGCGKGECLSVSIAFMALKAVAGAKSPSKGRRGIGMRPAADEVGGAAGGVEEGSGSQDGGSASSVRAINASTKSKSDRTAWPVRGASTRNPLGPTRQPGARLREPGCGARRGSSSSLPHSARCLAGGEGEKGIDALFIESQRCEEIPRVSSARSRRLWKVEAPCRKIAKVRRSR